jgi:hypothetical protein
MTNVPAIIFRNDDAGYVAWLAAHPSGLVLNCRKGKTGHYPVVHRARCRQLRLPQSSPYALTGAHFIKVCADTFAPLQAHAEQQHGGTLHHCRICNP